MGFVWSTKEKTYSTLALSCRGNHPTSLEYATITAHPTQYITCYLQVCAVNSAGVGAYSAVTECITLPDTPGCPLNVCLKERVTSTSLHIQWGEFGTSLGNTQMMYSYRTS